MRVGMLTTSFPREAHDHAGRFVLGFARALAAQGHQLEVLAPEPGDTRYQKPPALDGVEVRWVRYLPRRLERTFYGAGVLDNLQRDPLAWLGLSPFVLRLAREARWRASGWDAIVSHWALPCGLVAASLRPRPHHLAVLHSADVFVLERLPFATHVASRLASGAEQMLFVSRDLRRRFLRLLPPLERLEAGSKAHVCAMGIELEGAAPAETRAALRERLGLEGTTVLALGRLVPIKGLEDAIDATAGLDDVTLVIAGEGPLRPALEARAHERGAKVRFVGRVSGGEKQAWLTAADLFVQPSRVLPSGRSEGTPTALLEAMAAGAVPIASRTGGIPDVVSDGVSGLLIEPGDARALRAAIARLRDDPRLRRQLAQEARAVGLRYDFAELGPHLARLLSVDAEGSAV